MRADKEIDKQSNRHGHADGEVIIIIIIIITEMISMVLSSSQSHCESSPGSFGECRLSAEVAANPQTKPTDADCESARKKWQLPSTSTIAILLLLSLRAAAEVTKWVYF